MTAKKSSPFVLPMYVVVDEDTKVLGNVKIVTKDQIPPNQTCYIVSRDGVRMQKDTGLMKSAPKVKELPFLSKFEIKPEVRFRKIPPLVLAKAWRFFASAYKKYGSESELMLLYNKETHEWDLWCPEQEVSHGSVDYELGEAAASIPPEWAKAGTIHSHADFSAYHSGVDDADERNFDGVHITLGHVNQKACSISCSIMSDGDRYENVPEAMCLGVVNSDSYQNSTTKYVGFGRQDVRVTIDLQPEELEELKQFDKDVIQAVWMPRVTERVFKWKQGGQTYQGAYRAQGHSQNAGNYLAGRDITIWTQADFPEKNSLEDEGEGEWVYDRTIEGSNKWVFKSWEDLYSTATDESINTEVVDDINPSDITLQKTEVEELDDINPSDITLTTNETDESTNFE